MSLDSAASAVDDVKGVIARYAASISMADVALAAQIWLDSPDVSFIHPRGHERGWGQVKANFYEQTMGARFSGRELTVEDPVVRILGDTAIAEFYWRFKAVFRSDGTEHKTAGRETQILQRGRGHEWRLIHVHYSNMSVTGDRAGF